MGIEDLLGRFATLSVRRIEAHGAILSPGPGDARREGRGLLLPRREVPEGAGVGDPIDVFVYLDSEDRPIATTREPRLALGEVSFLEVTDLVPFGAFVDWGLDKELLVPRDEQTCETHVGRRYAVGLVIDASGRLAGTMRVGEMLRVGGPFAAGEWVEGEAWRNDPRYGVFVILERSCVGLLPAHEPHDLGRGERARFRVANVLADGKIELSLRRPAHEERASDADHVLEVLQSGRAPSIGEGASPDEIRSIFGLSKKSFKRAVGALLRRGDVTFDGQGHVRVLR